MKVSFEFYASHGYVHTLHVKNCVEQLRVSKHGYSSGYCVAVCKEDNRAWTECFPPIHLVNFVELRKLHCLTRVLELMYEET